MDKVFIIGAGATGLSAGYISGFKIFEAKNYPGGICSSYYMNRKGEYTSDINDSYRFEVGGGHWLFGCDKMIVEFLSKFSSLEQYSRSASIFFKENNLLIPYPIQENFHFLGPDFSKSVLLDYFKLNKGKIENITLYDWLLSSFGKSLCDKFFFPFHDLYTAGMYKHIKPQDTYKSPLNLAAIASNVLSNNASNSNSGYNSIFFYPTNGLAAILGLQKIVM
jgi:protoporphyrinogen oxidase